VDEGGAVTANEIILLRIEKLLSDHWDVTANLTDPQQRMIREDKAVEEIHDLIQARYRDVMRLFHEGQK
jgi:hypothetical protein